MTHWLQLMTIPTIYFGMSCFLYTVKFDDKNYMFGYKTPRALKTTATRNFANRFAQRYQLILSIVFIFITILIGFHEANTTKAVTISGFILALLSLSIIPVTEMLLVMIFDKHGNLKIR